MKTLLDLFMTFFKIGALTFGGGLAMLPMLERELSKKGYASEKELLDYYSIGQCTPGIIAVNTATFVGYKTKGIIGAIASTLGIVSPSIIIILAIASFIKNFLYIKWVMYALSGVKVAVCAMVLEVFINFCRKNIKDRLTLFLCILAFILNFIIDISPAYIIFASLVFSFFYTKKIWRKEKK